MHDILMITYKRAAFTQLSLSRLLETCDSQMRVWVWHNGDDQDTLDVVRSFRSHPRFHRLEISHENVKLRSPTNWFWRNSDGKYISKVDDDCLMTDGWAQTLRSAHEASSRLGIIGTWRFYEEDLVLDLVQKKLRRLSDFHKLMVHGFVQGSGYVMKREVHEQLGSIRANESFTGYCLRAAYRGWINGWYYPFIHEDHMDDARSPNYPIRTEEEFQKSLSLSQINFGVNSLVDWRTFSRMQARHLQTDIVDPKQFFGWRRLVQKIRNTITPEPTFMQRHKNLSQSFITPDNNT